MTINILFGNFTNREYRNVKISTVYMLPSIHEKPELVLHFLGNEPMVNIQLDKILTITTTE